MRRISLAAAVTQLANARSLRDWLRHCSIAGRLLLFATIFSLCAVPVFSERVISPVQGKFANKQSIILDLSECEEAFYSYTNTNPLDSGFAYDGPALIDMSGNVSLYVVVMSGESKESYEIEYTVEESNPFADGTFEKKFIDRVGVENVLLCTSENIINVPKTLLFSIGDGEKPRLMGGTLSVSADNKLSRYIPCTVTDGNLSWRFIIFLSPGEVGSFAKTSVPFEISGWTDFIFTGKNLIWCIDDGLWSASKETVRLDRTQKHTVYWQDVEYKAGNPVESFELPPKPSVRSDNFGKAVTFSVEGDLRYKMSVRSSGASGDSHAETGAYTSLAFDTFDGDYVKATAVFDFYCDGVYQGNISVPYEIDRQPPLPPRFVASESGEYARNDVSLNVESEEGAKIFLSVLGPFEVGSASYLDGNTEFDSVEPGEYFVYKSQQIELRAGVEKTVCYRAFAYAEDRAGNVSEVSSYKVIIDEYNYFLDASASAEMADGTRSHPYNSFEQVLDVINQGKFVHFFVKGSVMLPKGMSLISSNCSFTGMNDASFVLQPSSFIVVKNASLEIQNCLVQKDIEKSKDSDQRMFVVDKSAVSFEDCEILGNFASSGTALSSDASIVTFKNSGLTVQSSVYACAISGVNSKINLADSHVSSVSDTAVNFSLKGGTFTLNSCDCKVISHLGRILEAGGSNLRLAGNNYAADFDREAKGIKPVWVDEKCLFLEDRDNISMGFSDSLSR